MPAIVCAAVRSVGVMRPSPPRRLTSLNARVYLALVRAGGGGMRNWLAERSTNGFTSPHFAPRAIGMRLTGSCRHSPGPVPGM